MKKYMCIYAILYVVLLVLIITGGIPYGIILNEIDKRGMPDGSQSTTMLLIFNIIIALVVFVVGMITSCIKNNKLRFKWLFPIGILVFTVALVPIIQIISIGGLSAGVHQEYYSFTTSFWM